VHLATLSLAAYTHVLVRLPRRPDNVTSLVLAVLALAVPRRTCERRECRSHRLLSRTLWPHRPSHARTQRARQPAQLPAAGVAHGPQRDAPHAAGANLASGRAVPGHDLCQCGAHGGESGSGISGGYSSGLRGRWRLAAKAAAAMWRSSAAVAARSLAQPRKTLRRALELS
jgi:hypothetical protein